MTEGVNPEIHLGESFYYGELRCVCGWRQDLPDDIELEDAKTIWNGHVREEHEDETAPSDTEEIR